MARILVLGAGLGGLTTAMLLVRDGHQVTVLERDPVEPPTPELAWDRWERGGVNQFRLPHFMVPRWWLLVRAELPEVEPRLVAAGAARVNSFEALAPQRRGPHQDGDDRFETLTARRPVLEAALADAARAMGVDIRRGVTVQALTTGGGDRVPRITGVSTTDGTQWTADLVVDCSGRRSAISRWLVDAGARPPVEERAESGFVYYARHFRSDDGQRPAVHDSYLQNYHSVTLLTLPADEDTWCVVMTTASRDRALRALREVDRWDAAVARYPLVAHWAQSKPITGVDVFAGIEDRHRRLAVDGEPVATGVVVVGDSWSCTNPSLGRGATMAMIHGSALRNLLRDTDPADHDRLARRFDQVTAETVEPLYRMTVGYDNHRLAEIDADIEGVPYAPEDQSWRIGKALVAASQTDPDLTRAYYAISSFIATPPEVFGQPGILDRVLAAGTGAPQYPLPGPTRRELLDAIA